MLELTAVDAAVRDGGDVEAALWAAWNMVIDAAGTADDATRSALVRQLSALRRRDTGVRVWDLRLYADLPVFGAAMRERWNVEGPPGSWANVNAFAAQLTVAGLDFGLYALWTLRSALEGDHRPDLLPAATEWFRLAGPLLYESCHHGGPLHADGPPARTGPRCPGPPGFTPARWSCWRTGLTALGATTALGYMTAVETRAGSS